MEKEKTKRFYQDFGIVKFILDMKNEEGYYFRKLQKNFTLDPQY